MSSIVGLCVGFLCRHDSSVFAGCGSGLFFCVSRLGVGLFVARSSVGGVGVGTGFVGGGDAGTITSGTEGFLGCFVSVDLFSGLFRGLVLTSLDWDRVTG